MIITGRDIKESYLSDLGMGFIRHTFFIAVLSDMHLWSSKAPPFDTYAGNFA
jgi:hypothetical protein